VKKKQLNVFLLFALEMAVFSVFWVENGLGPLGVNLIAKIKT